MSRLPPAIGGGEELSPPSADMTSPPVTPVEPRRPPAGDTGVVGAAVPTRESTEASVGSRAPLIDAAAGASAASVQSGGPPRPMRGDLPADLQDDASPQSSSATFAPILRSTGIGAYPRAEAFLGRAVELPRPPEPSSGELRVARWLLEQRRVDRALRLLSRSGAGTSTDAAVIRLRCLVALRRYPAAAEELSRLSTAQGDGAGSALPFEARVLGAELPFLRGDADTVAALGQLQELSRRARAGTPGLGGAGADGRASLGERLHLMQVLSHVSLAAGHGRAAAEELSEALRAEEAGQGGSGGGSEPPGAAPARARLLSLLGRHHAHEGDVRAAAGAFERARGAGLPEDSAAAHLDRGILAAACGDYASARGHFVQASSASLASAGPGGLAELSPSAIDEAVAAENNLAVCRLYTKELREGVKGLEAFVKRSPVLFLQACVVQNLSSLYEFMTDGGQRRVTLKEVVDAFQLEDIEARCFEPGG